MSHYPDLAGPDVRSDPNLAALLAKLYTSHNDAICCTLVYGSCLRNGNIYDGLLDLYLICDNYRAAYQTSTMAAANWVLPPNVFYAEQKPVADSNGKTLRGKVTVISLQDFQRGCSKTWFQSYVWGRFAQPTRVLTVRNEQIRAQIEEALLTAARTLLQNAIPALPNRGSLYNLWEQALALSYATELRTERQGRAAELAQSAVDFYTTVTLYHRSHLHHLFSLEEIDGEWHYRSETGYLQHKLAVTAWALRRGQGKLLSVLRLLKALFTFEGGLDYIAWKLERHSGEEVVIPDKVRRAPLIHMWGFFWGLYRRGIFK